MWWRISSELCSLLRHSGGTGHGRRHTQLEQEDLVLNLCASSLDLEPQDYCLWGRRQLPSSPNAWKKHKGYYLCCFKFVNSEFYQPLDIFWTAALLNSHSRAYIACCHQLQAKWSFLAGRKNIPQFSCFRYFTGLHWIFHQWGFFSSKHNKQFLFKSLGFSQIGCMKLFTGAHSKIFA